MSVDIYDAHLSGTQPLSVTRSWQHRVDRLKKKVEVFNTAAINASMLNTLDFLTEKIVYVAHKWIEQELEAPKY